MGIDINLEFKKMLNLTIKSLYSFVFFLSLLLPPTLLSNEKNNKEVPTFELPGIVITATRTPNILKNVPIETNLITQEEIKKACINTVAEAIRWIPGVNISGGAPYGANQRLTGMIRGLPSPYSLVLIDGKRTKSEHIHTGVNMNIIPVEMVERIEVVKGPSSVLYGSDAMGGVVNIIIKSVPEEGTVLLSSDLSYGSFNNREISLNHGFKPGYIGYFLSGKFEETDGVQGNWYKQKNLLSKVSYDITKDDKILLDTRYYMNNYLRNEEEVNDSELAANLSWGMAFDKKTSLDIEGAYCRFSGSSANCTNITSSLEILYRDKFFKEHSAVIGLEARSEDFERISTPHKNITIFSSFIQDEWEINKNLNSVLAIRLDYHPKAGMVLTPKASALYKITEFTKLRTSIGRGFRAPSLQDLYEYHYFHHTFLRDGNPDLKPEYSMDYSLGIEHRFSSTLLARISAFRNDFTNMIKLVNTGIVEDSLPVLERRNVNEAYTQGIEIEARYKISGLSLIVGYTFLDSGDEDGKVLSYSPKHLTCMRANYNLDRFGVNILLSVEDGRERYYKNKDENVEKLDNYILMNLSVNKEINNHLDIYFNVENLFDQEFETYEEGKAEVSFGRTFRGGLKVEL